MTASHLVSTQATATTCPRCDTPLLVALDEGLTARVDAKPIQPSKEIAVLLEGRWTYNHAHKQLAHRDPARIRTDRTNPIHAEHRCPQRSLF